MNNVLERGFIYKIKSHLLGQVYFPRGRQILGIFLHMILCGKGGETENDLSGQKRFVMKRIQFQKQDNYTGI